MSAADNASFRARRYARALADAGTRDDPEIRSLVSRFVEILDRLEPMTPVGAERLRESARLAAGTVVAAKERAEVLIAIHEVQRHAALPEAGELAPIVRQLAALIRVRAVNVDGAVKLMGLISSECRRAGNWIEDLSGVT